MAKKEGLSIVVLTGAGVSAESGLPTFRGAGGLWEGQRVEDVASPEAFSRDPQLVQRFYNLRRAALDRVQPNAAHLALARLERDWPGKFLLITQNVDDLHERAGSRKLIHMHGELRKVRCTASRWQGRWEGDVAMDTPCPECSRTGSLRPHIVWFGEVPMGMDRCIAALEQADVFAAIGTSGRVYPAASFVSLVAARPGTRRVELNVEATGNPEFAEVRLGPAGEIVPAFVEALLNPGADPGAVRGSGAAS